MEDLEVQVKELIIEALSLEDMLPADIDSTAPLFGEGLGLDSIDALELGVALRERFGITLRGGDEAIRRGLSSVRSLVSYIKWCQSAA
ncbi:MAG: acyl carrier protein [Succinivibrionaceae bacterium]|nr:acyl carrier protein [Succinivibrionaceae bacterium]